MPALSFLGCPTTGHGCWPPTIISPAPPMQTSVLTGLVPVTILGQPTVPHCCHFRIKNPCRCHFGLCAGFVNVMVSLRPVQTVGHPIACCGGALRDLVAGGNPSVLVGGF